MALPFLSHWQRMDILLQTKIVAYGFSTVGGLAWSARDRSKGLEGSNLGRRPHRTAARRVPGPAPRARLTERLAPVDGELTGSFPQRVSPRLGAPTLADAAAFEQLRPRGRTKKGT